jgi:benzoyl-CoA reductase/2-hydroxyglutaryl-CoA dehydratase subunit BcrC/BadD/HgdB
MATLTTRQKKAIEAILQCPTLKAAAAKIGVGERTLYRWTKQPAFAAALAEIQEEALAEASGLLKLRSRDAVYRLAKEMEAKKPSATRVSAAAQVLAFAVKYIDSLDMRTKFFALEAELKEQGHLKGKQR